jgi:nucleoside-diphosphate-sugar epimerase
VTQLGHVKDLATAFVKILGNPKAARQVYNLAGERFVTFDGLAKACAAAMGAPEPELVHFNPKDFDFGKSKAFPMRDQHFFASVDKVGEWGVHCSGTQEQQVEHGFEGCEGGGCGGCKADACSAPAALTATPPL